MLQPTRKTNQLGLSGQSLFGYGQAKKARQPSGANAPQRQPGTEKLIGLNQPLSGMAPQAKPGKVLATNYYQMPTTPMSQPKQSDMGLYGPSGSNNRIVADEAYRSFQGPTIGKGPVVPNTSGQPGDYLQRLYNSKPMQGGMQRVEDNASKQDPQEPKLVQTQYGWEYNEPAKKILNDSREAIRRAYESRNAPIPFVRNLDSEATPTTQSRQQPTPQQTQPTQGPYTYTTNTNPELDRWTDLGVSPVDYYALKDGTVSPEQWETLKQKAIQAQMDRFYGVSPERQQQLDADIERDRELARKRAAEDAGKLAYTGAINDGYSAPTNRQTDYYGQRRESMDAMNERLDEGGGLQYRQGSTGFGTPEQGAQAAADFNTMSDNDNAKQDAYNTQQDAQFDDWRAKQAEIYGQQQSELGVRDPQQASTDIRSLSGQFAAITRSGEAKGLKFLDFIQNKIDRGELGIGDDAVKIISKNYNHEFSDQDKDRAGMYQQQWGNPLNAARDAYGQRQAAQDEVRAAGMAQRQQIAAQQGADRAREAKLIAQGLTPAAARAAVAQQNATADYYNQQRLNNQDRLTADILTRQAELAQKDQEDARRYLDRESQRAYDALNPKATGSGKAKQPNAADGSAGSSGTTGSKSTGSKSKQPENPRVTDSVSSLQASKEFRKNKPESFLAAAQHFEAQGLSPEEQTQAFNQLYETDFSDPERASGTIKNLTKFAHEQAKQKGSWTDSWGTTSRLKETEVLAQAPVFKALMLASRLTLEEVSMLVYPEEFSMGTRDAFLPERRQRLIEALGGNPTSEE